MFIVAAMLVLTGCSDQGSTSASNVTPEQVAAIAAAKQPPKPSHYYSLEEEGQYGYESGISENEEKAGTRAKPLMMIRYLGEKDGTHTIGVVDGSFRQTYSCKTPCDFVKSKSYISGQQLKQETIRTAEGSVIWAIMQDAQNGFLTPYKNPRRDSL